MGVGREEAREGIQHLLSKRLSIEKGSQEGWLPEVMGVLAKLTLVIILLYLYMKSHRYVVRLKHIQC